MHRSADLSARPGSPPGFTGRVLPVIARDIPIMYEDEGQENMDESLPHSTSIDILNFGIQCHMAPRPDFRVLRDMNLYYSTLDRLAYISPDIMVVTPPLPLPEDLSSYRIGEQG